MNENKDSPIKPTFNKCAWAREYKRKFREKYGYSLVSHYGCGGNRKKVLERDQYRCVVCGMTDEEHKSKFGRPITIDHKDKNRKNNSMDNLQTMCLPCHGRKDLIEELRKSKIQPYSDKVMKWRSEGKSCNWISKQIGVQCNVVTKWVRRWNGGHL